MKSVVNNRTSSPPPLGSAAVTRLGASAALLLFFSVPAESGRADPIRSTLQPDLVIVDVQSVPANPNRLRVRVANQGLAPAVESWMELVYVRGGKATPMSAAVPLLQAGERQWLVFEMGAPAADADRLVLRIDEPPRVIESDESNNGFVFKE